MAAAAPSNNAVGDWYKEWTGRTPFVTRTTIQILGVLYVLGWFSSFSMAMVNIPYYTVLRFELYRLTTANLFCNSILNLIFSSMWFTSTGAQFERSLGSARFGCLLVLISIASNVVFVIFCFLMALLGTYEALFFQSQGFWVILFGLLAIECAESTEPTRQFFSIPYQIPTPYYPLVLFALFSVFSGVDIGLAIGMGFGYAYGYGKVEMLRPSLVLIQGWENGCLANFTTYPGFISSGAALGSGAWSMDAAAQQMETGNSIPIAAAEAMPFPGGGQTLSSNNTVNKEEARRARVAALESTAYTKTTSRRWPAELKILVDMGYDEEVANQALGECGGNLRAAAERLS